MTTTTIQTGTTVVTLVNVFTVRPERQREVVDVLVRATDEVMRKRPGFISANIHASLDGERVVNYAQWNSEDDFHAMLADPVAGEHMAEVMRVAVSAEPRLYTVESVHHADR
jgi:heme-degrading monooxygenase HmoA